MALDRADEASPRPDPPPPQQPLSLPLPDPDRRWRLPPHRSPIVSHRPSTPAISLSLAPNPDPNLRLSVLHPDPDLRWHPMIQPLPSSSAAHARVQRPESQASISSSRLAPFPSAFASLFHRRTAKTPPRSPLSHPPPPRLNLDAGFGKRARGWSSRRKALTLYCRHAKPAGGCFRGKEEIFKKKVPEADAASSD
ncbi:hypothetical protein VPH35_084320 [Triticum aestivum]